MNAIYKKELRSNLTNVIGIIFIAVTLIAFGWNFILLSFRAAVAKVEFAFVHFLGMKDSYIYIWISNGFPLITLILTSLLTMKVFPEERHQKTDMLLYSLPISAVKVVLGKYLALVTIFAIPFAEFLFAPVIAGTYGKVNYWLAYGTILGYFLLGCAVIAICMFISSLTSNQVVCAVSGIAAVIAIYFLPQLSGSVGGIFGKIISSIGLFGRMEDFANGIVDVGTYIYYLSVAAMFVFFTVQSFEKRRWS